MLRNKVLFRFSNFFKNECLKRKLVLVFALSVFAVSVDLKYVNCDKININPKGLGEVVSKNSHDNEDDRSKLDWIYEKIEQDSHYFLKNQNKVYMVQYAANTPIEDRCFIYDLSDNWNEKEKKITRPIKGRKIENEYDLLESFIKTFESKLLMNTQAGPQCQATNALTKLFQEKQSLCSSTSKGTNDFLFAGVVDGHGGSVIAEIVKRALGLYVKKELSKRKNTESSPLNEREIVNSLKNAHLNLDDDIKEKVKEYFMSGQTRFASIGACCISVLMDKNNYYISNVGDSKGILGRTDGFITLNNLHSANNVKERIKLIENHPNEEDIVICKTVKNKNFKNHIDILNVSDHLTKLMLDNYDHCYVKGRLQPTRDFGDFYLKDAIFSYDFIKRKYSVRKPHSYPYVTSTPEIKKVQRSKEDEFIVLVTDGVSDFLTDKEIYDIIKKNINKSVEKAAKELVDNVLQKAALAAGISVQDLINISPEYKRMLHDDTTVLLIKLYEEK